MTAFEKWVGRVDWSGYMDPEAIARDAWNAALEMVAANAEAATACGHHDCHLVDARFARSLMANPEER